MKTYSVIKVFSMWSTTLLAKKVELILNEKSKDGYEIITVSFGINMFWLPTAYITVCK